MIKFESGKIYSMNNVNPDKTNIFVLAKNSEPKIIAEFALALNQALEFSSDSQDFPKIVNKIINKYITGDIVFNEEVELIEMSKDDGEDTNAG